MSVIAVSAATAATPTGPTMSRRAASYLEYFEARELVAEGRVEEARRKLEQILAADPAAAEVHAALARLCLRDGDVLCADSHARQAIELAPQEAEGHRIEAELSLQRSQRVGDPQALEQALAELAAAAAAQPADPWVWSTWIRALAGDGRVAEAEDVARRAGAVPGLDPAAPYLMLARILLARGDSSAATSVLERVDVSGRGGAAVLEMLADLKGATGDLAGQSAALQKLYEFRPDDPDIAHRLGAVRLELGDDFGALAPLRVAFEARESDPVVRRDLARALVGLGKGADALPILRELPPVERGPHTLLLWAQGAEQAGQFAEAADRLEELLTKLSENDLKTNGLILRLRAARDRLRGRQYNAALALLRGQEDDVSALRIVVQTLDASGRRTDADALLRAHRSAHPGAPALAALVAERASQQGGRSAGVDAALVELRSAANRPAAAAEAATWMTAWDDPLLGAALIDAVGLPASPSADELRARASTLSAAGRFGEAEAAFRRLLEVNPQDAGALNDLGYLLADQGRSLDEAVQMLRKAVTLRPDEPEYLDSLGWALHRAGRSAEALPLLRQAMQKSQERAAPAIREHLGDVYQALGDSDRARSEWEAALAMGSDQESRLRKKISELTPRGGR